MIRPDPGEDWPGYLTYITNLAIADRSVPTVGEQARLAELLDLRMRIGEYAAELAGTPGFDHEVGSASALDPSEVAADLFRILGEPWP
jgi:hypothetical protein